MGCGAPAVASCVADRPCLGSVFGISFRRAGRLVGNCARLAEKHLFDRPAGFRLTGDPFILADRAYDSLGCPFDGHD